MKTAQQIIDSVLKYHPCSPEYKLFNSLLVSLRQAAYNVIIFSDECRDDLETYHQSKGELRVTYNILQVNGVSSTTLDELVTAGQDEAYAYILETHHDVFTAYASDSNMTFVMDNSDDIPRIYDYYVGTPDYQKTLAIVRREEAKPRA